MGNKEKDNLILISPMLHQGGFERVCVLTARMLEPYYNVSIVIFNDANIAYDISGLNIINLDLGVKKSVVGKIINVFKRSAALKKVKNELKPIAAYSFGPTANYVNCLSRTKDTKVITGLRNYTDIEKPSDIKLFMKKADAIVSCSAYIDDDLKQKFMYDKGFVLHNPFDLDMIKDSAKELSPELPWDKEENTITLTAMGRVAPQKGFWHLVKAFSIIYKKHPDARLLIMGAGNFDRYYELCDALGCRDAVFFAGMQKNPFAYVDKADIYVLTSENEGFPNVLVEGMALGKPAVSVDCESGPREILLSDEERTGITAELKEPVYGAYGILCPKISKGENFDPAVIEQEEEIFADAVLKLIEEPDLYKEYSAKATLRSQDFAQDKYCKKLTDIINKVCED